MPFKKGQPKIGGRTKGTMNKDTRNYLDLQAFAKLIWDGMDEAGIVGKERIELAIRCINLMFQKIQSLPGTPLDSVRNAEQASAMLKSLEVPAIKDDINT